MNRIVKLKALAIILLTASLCTAQVKLPSVIGSNMVLQRNSKAAVWGWAEPGEKVKVKPNWGLFNFGKSVTADENGHWKVELDTPGAGGPFTITIKGENKIKLDNILTGEVWICSGQSNMEMPITGGWAHINNVENTLEKAGNYPDIHIFNVEEHVSIPEPREDCKGQWKEATADNIKGFSAVGYLFARKLSKELNVPVGMIGTNWGGSSAEAWMSKQALEEDSDFRPILEREKNRDNHTPAGLYNGMLNPLIPYTIKGVIWYQGESNSDRAYQYRKLFPAMIEDWRESFGQGDFPFYYVQIAPYNYGNPDGTKCSELQEAQLMSLSVPNTGMAVTADIGNNNDIHPKNKLDVANRLARWAFAKDYGYKDLVYSGPLYKDMEIEGNKVRMFFDYTAEGLTVKGGTLRHFEIAGKDKEFVPATAIIESDTVVVWSEQVENPAAVRYAFHNALSPEPNLYNSAGLPASPFRTDDWKGETYGKK